MVYKVYFTIKNSYVVDVEAEDRDEACEIVQSAINVDDDAFLYDREWYDSDEYIEEVRLKDERKDDTV